MNAIKLGAVSYAVAITMIVAALYTTPARAEDIDKDVGQCAANLVAVGRHQEGMALLNLAHHRAAAIQYSRNWVDKFMRSTDSHRQAMIIQAMRSCQRFDIRLK